MKYFYIVAEVDENAPNYDFVLKAKNLKDAEKQAKKIIKHDYPEAWEYGHAQAFSVMEVNKDKLMNILLVN